MSLGPFSPCPFRPMFSGDEFSSPGTGRPSMERNRRQSSTRRAPVVAVHSAAQGAQIDPPSPTAASPSPYAGPATIRTLLSARRRSSAAALLSAEGATGTVGEVTPPQVVTPPAASPSTLLSTQRTSLTQRYGGMRVRELKALLDAAGISYAGVNERSELVALLVDHQLSSPDAVGIDTTPLVRRLSLRDADVPALEELVLFPSVLNPAVMFAPGEAISNEFESIVSRASALHGEPGPDEPGVVVGFDSEGRISLQFVNQRPEDADTVEDALSLLRRIHSLQRRVAELTGQGMTALTELSQTHNLAALSVPPPLSLSDTRRVRFCEAVAAGEIAAVESLLVDDALELVSFFNTSGLYGVMDHPLTSAVMKGHLPLLSTLLAAGFMDGNHVFPSGQSALHAACSSGCTDPSILLHLLQNSGLDLLNLPSSLDGSTPLWAATVSNDSFAVSALTSAGAAVDAIASKTNTTPLWEACARDFAKVARTLLAAGADLNFKRETDSVNPLWIACANGSTQCVSLLLKQATPAQQQEATASALSPMAVACALGHTHIVDLLASSSGEPPWASIHGHLHLVKLFLP